MIIIIEGADRTGKTRLATEICQAFKYDYKHFGVPGPNPADEYLDFLLNLKTPTVCDRFYVGELVYGPMLRQKESITPFQRSVIERVVRYLGGFIIHADTDWGLVKERFLLSKEPISLEQNAESHMRFKTVMKSIKIPRVRYNGRTEIDLSEAVFQLHPFIDMQLERSKFIPIHGIGTTIGPKIIFIGDALSSKNSWMRLPFSGGPASTFFFNQLAKSKIDERFVYVQNQDTLTKEQIDLLRTDQNVVVALGNEAAGKLNKLRCCFIQLPHPQYWNRFQKKNHDRYSEMLDKVNRMFHFICSIPKEILT